MVRSALPLLIGSWVSLHTVSFQYIHGKYPVYWVNDMIIACKLKWSGAPCTTTVHVFCRKQNHTILLKEEAEFGYKHTNKCRYYNKCTYSVFSCGDEGDVSSSGQRRLPLAKSCFPQPAGTNAHSTQKWFHFHSVQLKSNLSLYWSVLLCNYTTFTLNWALKTRL